MDREREFYNVFDECLERVLIRGETVEQCLAAYPEYDAELEPLLRTALATKEAVDIKPRPDFRERARYQFQAALWDTEQEKSRGFFSWQPKWVTALVAIIVLLLASSGTMVAAGNSLPDEPLYQVKLATETLRLAFTFSAVDKAELYVELADERVNEIVEMANEGKVAHVERTAELLSSQLMAMANLDVSGGAEMVDTEATTFEAARSEVMMEEVPMAQVSEAVPAPAIDVPATVEEAPTAEEKEAVMTAPKAPATASSVPVEEKPIMVAVPEEAAPATAPVEEAPIVAVPKALELTEGFAADEQAQLRLILSRRAVKNSEALWAVLEMAPESVKPALRRAIEQAIAGYEQALGNLD